MFGRVRVARSLVVVLATVLAGGLAVAQQQGPEPPEPPEDSEGAVEVQARADLTGPEMLSKAEEVQEKGTAISRRIQSMLDQARRERDIIRVTCLNDKLTQVNANNRTLEDRVENLDSAVQADDTDRRHHEFTVVTVLAQKLNVLEQEANQCIGQDIFETGATRVVTDIDPAAPDEDPSNIDEPPSVDVPFIPPPLSPTA
ncbi:MAG: hypothetical protein ACODAG_06725 [Myxococcota bacterium]